MNKYNLSFFFIICSLLINGQSATVYFPLDKSYLTDSAKTVLQSLSSDLESSEKLAIYCHCDSSGSVQYNQVLSEKRVYSVKEFLGELGHTNFENEEFLGFGKLNPKYDNSSKERFKNRRCDIYLSALDSALENRSNVNSLDSLELKEGISVTIPKLEFVGNQAVPNWYSMSSLVEVLKVMKRHPDLEIELRGHVCCSRNKPLSEARALTVYNYLIGNGIEESRMSYKGYSNSVPLVQETSEENMQKNRRVEIFVVNTPKEKVDWDPVKETSVFIELIDIEFPADSYLLQSSSFYNLNLLAEMIAESKGYYYRLYVYEKKGNQALSVKRKNAIQRQFAKRRCKSNQYKIIPKGKHPSIGGDLLLLEIVKR